jgi:hypothetical protein
MKHTYKILLLACLIVCSFFIINCTKESEVIYKMDYDGAPFLDTVQALAIQTIPGRVQCEFYDSGGPGIAYYDIDAKNNGSGGLNVGSGYLNNFRKSEAPDMSYTKFHDQIDNSPYDMVQPEINQLYLGWTEPGEWTRYSVDVNESADFIIGAMYTSNRGGAIRLFIDDTDTTDFINIPTTYNAADPLSWRQWHHWNYIDSLSVVHINKGRRIITLKIEKQGNFNFDFINFQHAKQ